MLDVCSDRSWRLFYYWSDLGGEAGRPSAHKCLFRLSEDPSWLIRRLTLGQQLEKYAVNPSKEKLGALSLDCSFCMAGAGGGEGGGVVRTVVVVVKGSVCLCV